MPKSRLDTFPPQLFHPEYEPKTGKATSLLGVCSDSQATKLITKFSGINKKYLALFKPELEKRYAKKILRQVLTGNHDKVVAMAKTHPALFFIKATAIDYAMDFNGNTRTYEDWSPYQALFATGAVDTLAAVKPYLDKYLATIPNGNDLAYNQEQEKFANGFDFPESTYDFSALVAAITQDQQLQQDWKNPSPATIVVLEQFRKDFMPRIVKSGHPFNMNDFIKAHEVYNANWNLWSGNQLSFFAVNVIGYLERLLTAPYLQAACQGLDNIINNNQALTHSFEVMNYAVAPPKKMPVVPFNSTSSLLLGRDFVVDSYYGRRLGPRGRSVRAAAAGHLWKTMSSKYNESFKTYAHTAASNALTMRDCVKK